MKITTVGQAGVSGHAADWEGRAVLRKRLRRDQVAEFFANLSPCIVGLEACVGSHYWPIVLYGAIDRSAVRQALCEIQQERGQ
jgi:transposase